MVGEIIIGFAAEKEKVLDGSLLKSSIFALGLARLVLLCCVIWFFGWSFVYETVAWQKSLLVIVQTSFHNILYFAISLVLLLLTLKPSGMLLPMLRPRGEQPATTPMVSRRQSGSAVVVSRSAKTGKVGLRLGKLVHRKRVLVVLMLILLTGSFVHSAFAQVNNPPVANAGSDVAYDEGAYVFLDGSASFDPDGDVLRFSWTQTAGPSVTLKDDDAARPSFVAPKVHVRTVLTFQLIVNDGTSDSLPDNVVIIVNDVAYGIARQLSFSDVLVLGSTPKDSGLMGALVWNPEIAVSGNNVYVVWGEWRAYGYKPTYGEQYVEDIRFKVSRDSGLTFGPIINLTSNPIGTWSVDPKIAASENNVYVVWVNTIRVDILGTDGKVSWIKYIRQLLLMVSHDFGVTFSPAQKLSEGEPTISPDIAAYGSSVYVAWSAAGNIFFRASNDNGTNFGPTTLLSSDWSACPAIAASEHCVYVVWEQRISSAPISANIIREIRFTASHDFGVSFSPAKRLGEAGAQGPVWDIAASESNVYVVWVGKPTTPADTLGDIFFRASNDRGVNFNTVVALSPTLGLSYYPRIAASGRNVYVVWMDPFLTGDFSCSIPFRVSKNGGISFSPTFWVSGGTYPTIAAVRGKVHIAWQVDWLKGEIRYRFAWLFNEPPIANAGPDQFVNEGAEVKLDGTGSFDGEGDTISYSWTQTDGPSVILMYVDTPNPTFTAPAFPAHLTFQLTVNDGVYDSPPDFVDVFVGVDLALLEVKPVQAAFDTAVLVDGRKTLLYVKILNSFSEDIETYVKLVYDTFESGTKLTKTTYESIKLPANSAKWFYLPRTFYIIPSEPDFTFSVEVDPFNHITEKNEANNALSPKTLTVKDTKPLRVLYVPIIMRSDAFPLGDWSGFAAGSSSFIKATFPIDESEFREVKSINPILLGPGPLDAKEVEDLFRKLERMKWFSIFGIELSERFDVVVGVVRPNWFNEMTTDDKGGVGLAYLGGYKSCIVESEYVSGITTAHEVAHTYGWVTKGHYIESQTSPAHTSIWLKANGLWVYPSRSEMRNMLDFMHFEVGSPAVIDRWVSNYTFNYLLDKMKEDPADPKVIAVSGLIFKNGTTVLDPWYRFDGTLDIPLGNQGEFTILYIDKDGNMIGQTGFDTNSRRGHREEGELGFGGFALTIPDLEGTAKIILKRADQFLAEREFSPNPPQIRVMSPNGGEVFKPGETISVAWESLDPDSDSPTYVVSLSEDNGVTWVPLALDLTETQFSFEVPSNIMSVSCLIRVTATDGVNTAEDMSDSTFTITRVTIDGEIGLGPALNLSNNAGSSDLPIVAVSGNHVYTAWRDFTGTAPSKADIFFRASSDKGATFDSTVNLANSPEHSNWPIIVASGSNVYVAWLEHLQYTRGTLSWSAPDLLFRASSDNGATFGPTINLSNDDFYSACSYYGGIAASGSNVYVVWTNSSPVGGPYVTNQEILFRRSIDSGTTFSPAIKLSSAPDLSSPQVAASGNNVYIVWIETIAGHLQVEDGKLVWVPPQDVVFLKVSNDGGATFGPAINLRTRTTSRPTGWPRNPEIAVSGSNVFVAWDEVDGTTGKVELFFRASNDNSTTFGPAVSLADNWKTQMVAVGSNVYVMWGKTLASGKYALFLRRSIDSGATFDPVTNLTEVDQGRSLIPKIAASGSNVYVTWREISVPIGLEPSIDELVFLMCSTDNGTTFGSQVVLNSDVGRIIAGPSAQPPQIAADDNNVYVVWADPIPSLTSAPFNLEVFFRTSRVGIPNTPPVADDQSVVTYEDKPVFIALTGSDKEGDALTFSVVSEPASGTLSGTLPYLTYSPYKDFIGTDSFTFKTNDGKAYSNIATVSIAVKEVAPKVNNPPTADDQNVSTEQKTKVIITLTSNDVDKDTLTFSVVTTPTHGTLSPILLVNETSAEVVYTPNPNFNGSDSFTFKADDGKAESNIATVNITVNLLIDNAAPSFNVPPTPANCSTYIVNIGDTITFIIQCSDPDTEDTVAIIPLQPPLDATLTPFLPTGKVANGTFTWTPTYPQTARITFVAMDNHGSSVMHSVILIATENRPPQAHDLAVQTDEDTQIEIRLAAYDPDGDAMSYTVVTTPVHGALSGTAPTLTYTPNADFNGPDSFTFKVNDGAVDSNVATVSITVNPVNDAPILSAIGDKVVDEITLLTFTATATDVDQDALTFTLSGAPTGASITPNGVFTWIPTQAQGPGSYTFDIVVSDGALTDRKTITVTVNDIITPGKITGGGAQTDNRVNFGFNVQSDGASVKGQLEYQDKDSNINLHSVEIISLNISPDKTKGIFFGTATINGKAGFTFKVEVEDNGEPGFNDKFKITIPELSYTKSSTLTNGNIQIHK